MLEGHSGGLEEVWIGFLGHWMVAGWLADGLAGAKNYEELFEELFGELFG